MADGAAYIDSISIHVPLAGDDGPRARPAGAGGQFLSTSPLRGTTGVGGNRHQSGRISIHVPLAGDDPNMMQNFQAFMQHFYPRPPCGGRPGAETFRVHFFAIFLSTSPLRGTTEEAFLSIWVIILFLSTSPLRGTTFLRGNNMDYGRHFYPRPPCGGRHLDNPEKVQYNRISIHVPLAGDDLPSRAYVWLHLLFLSTSPLRGTTTQNSDTCSQANWISIHVPLAGDD